MHKRARDLVVAHGGAGLLIGRWVGKGLHRKHIGTRVIGKGDAEAIAIGWGDEGELAPACCTQAFFANQLAAGEAERRECDIDRPAGCGSITRSDMALR
jgi:hypothetical protein